ncbi:signal peptidase II [Roseibium limicola]|uniref:Lipoprotein signal peptidase n=1 Tax=Roseibium limicola TaxID=2816037 RepID=A0A939ENX9_9HYPH|nr:signal peptidase II [Roseibium limicola]MBO0345853.1 signal peptidase II [Roseibium limicola]
MSETGVPITGGSFSRRWLWGSQSQLVAWITLVGLVLDQASKLWVLFGAQMTVMDRVPVLPVLDMVLVWNRGISYGLLQQDSDLGRWLLAGFTLVVAVGLWVWSVRSVQKLVVISLALILGGALGNGIDRLAYGAVVDFVHFHIGDFSWYVFNLADVWIVAGVAGLLYDSFRGGPNSAAK